MTRRTRALAAVGAAAVSLLGATPLAAAQPNTDSLMPPQRCDIDLDALAAQTPVPEDWKDWHKGWEPGPSDNLGGDLGYVVLETKGGTGSSPSHVVLFHRCVPTRTQPSGITRAKVAGHSNFFASIGFKANLSDLPNAAQPYDHTLWVWNPALGDAQGFALPPGVTL